MKYVGDDTFDEDEAGQLAACRFHVFSQESAGSLVLDEAPAILSSCSPELAVSPLLLKEINWPDPQRHAVFGANVIVAYGDSWSAAAGCRIVRPHPQLFAFIHEQQLSHCVITDIDTFDLRVGAQEVVPLAELPDQQRGLVIGRLTHAWIYEDSDEDMLRLLAEWHEQEHTPVYRRLPASVQQLLHDQSESWAELVDE